MNTIIKFIDHARDVSKKIPKEVAIVEKEPNTYAVVIDSNCIKDRRKIMAVFVDGKMVYVAK